MSSLKSKTELLLALLFSPERAGRPATTVRGITRLEKLLFLLRHEHGFLKDVPDDKDFHFVPFRMGPWTQEVYDEVDFLESLGLLLRKESGKRPVADVAHDDELFSSLLIDKYQRRPSTPLDGQESFALTERGRQKAREIWERLTPAEKTKIMELKASFNHMDLRQLLRYVYKKYPSYTSESEIREALGFA